jgi:hypothetical protein
MAIAISSAVRHRDRRRRVRVPKYAFAETVDDTPGGPAGTPRSPVRVVDGQDANGGYRGRGLRPYSATVREASPRSTDALS